MTLRPRLSSGLAVCNFWRQELQAGEKKGSDEVEAAFIDSLEVESVEMEDVQTVVGGEDICDGGTGKAPGCDQSGFLELPVGRGGVVKGGLTEEEAEDEVGELRRRGSSGGFKDERGSGECGFMGGWLKTDGGVEDVFEEREKVGVGCH